MLLYVATAMCTSVNAYYYPIAVSKYFHSFDLTLDELLTNKTQLAISTIFPTERVEVRPDEIGSRLLGYNE